jgi:aspartyl/asparaginyl-tRNA synthetase
MLNGLKKKLGIVSDNNQEEKVEMTETNQAEMSVITAELTELKATFAQVSATLADTQAQLEAATTALASVAAEKEAVEAAAKQAKMDARMTKLVSAVGDERAVALMAATEQLDDAAFDAVATAVTVNMDKEAESEMFSEAGVDAQAAPVVEKDAVSRLAENIAAQFNLKK